MSRVIDRPADAPQDGATLLEVERWLRRRRTESAYGFDPSTGKMVWERHTDGMEVPLTDDDRRRLRGMIFTHNHPRGWTFPETDPRRAGSSFSPADVHMAAFTGLHELRAVSPGYVYTLNAGAGGWPAATSVEPMVDIAAARRDQETAAATLRGTLNPIQATADDLHAIWTELGPLLGLEYRREVWGV